MVEDAVPFQPEDSVPLEYKAPEHPWLNELRGMKVRILTAVTLGNSYTQKVGTFVRVDRMFDHRMYLVLITNNGGRSRPKTVYINIDYIVTIEEEN